MSGQAQSIAEIDGGSRWALIGNPNTALGAGMVSLGRLVRVSRTPELFRQIVKNEVGQVVKQYGQLTNYSIEIEMQKNSATILAAMVTEFSDATTSVSMATTFAEITGQTLCLVKDDVVANGTPLTDLSTEWYVSVTSTNMGAMVSQIVNGDDQPTFTVTFNCQYATTEDGNALTADYEIAFRGDPADATAGTWSLPATTAW